MRSFTFPSSRECDSASPEGGRLTEAQRITRRVLDLSFNLLRAVPDNLENLTSLRTVYFVQNRISKITGFGSVTSLTSLELGGNKIRVCHLKLRDELPFIDSFSYTRK